MNNVSLSDAEHVDCLLGDITSEVIFACCPDAKSPFHDIKQRLQVRIMRRLLHVCLASIANGQFCDIEQLGSLYSREYNEGTCHMQRLDPWQLERQQL